MDAVIFESVRDYKMLVQQLERHETQRRESNGNFPHAPFFWLGPLTSCKIFVGFWIAMGSLHLTNDSAADG